MFWHNDSDTPPTPPATTAEAIKMLEDALHEVLTGIHEAERLNANEKRPADPNAEYPKMEMRFSDPPPQWEGAHPFEHCWVGEGFDTQLATPSIGCKPQTRFVRFSNLGTWKPEFHMRVQWGISLTVQALAPLCEAENWPTDPFDRLVSPSVDTPALLDKKNLTEALQLAAKLRRRYGLPGAAFWGVPSTSDQPVTLNGQTASPEPNLPKYLFRRSGKMWALRFDGEQGNYSADLKGFGIIARLLIAPNPSRRISAMDLIGQDTRLAETEYTYQETLDPEAIQGCRRKIKELEDEIAEAEKAGDSEQKAELKEELSKYKTALGQATNNRGKARPLGSAKPEKSAQTSVRAAITRAIEDMAEDMPKLASHLKASITIGQDCKYCPPSPIPWKLD